MNRSSLGSGILFLLAGLAFLLPSSTDARSGGSFYSRYGIGDTRPLFSDRSRAMGGAGIAAQSSGLIDRLNPASLAAITRTRYSLGVLYQGYSTRDSRNSVFLSGANFEGASLAIPLSPERGIALGLGVSPLSALNYDVSSLESQGNYSYSLTYKGDGGLSLAHIGVSTRIGSNVLAGARFNYYFGRLRNITQQQFTGNLFTGVEAVRNTRLSGVGATFGLIVTGLDDLLGLSDGKTLNFGIILSSRSSLTSQEERYYTYSTGAVTTTDSVIAAESSLPFPISLGAGISYGTSRVTLAADLQYQRWSELTAFVPPGGLFRDSYRYSMGGELIPSHENEASFIESIAYRIGFFYHQSYLQIRNEPIDEIGFTGGFGLPIVGDTRIHVSGEYSLRGTTEKQLQKDKILRISLTLSGSELWFVRPPEE